MQLLSVNVGGRIAQFCREIAHFMDGRPLTNDEFWNQLIARNCGRTDPLRHRNKLLLLLAGLAGLRESEHETATSAQS
jgi:hypothetical protein